MTTENSTPIDVTDDLDSFSNELFGNKPVEEKIEAPSNDAEDTSSEDDALDTNEQTDIEEADSGDTEDEAPKPKGKKSAQERISEVVKQRETEKARADALEARLAALEATSKKTEVPTPAPVVVGAPTADDKNEDGSDKYPLGEFDPKYNADLTKYNARQAWEEIQAEEQAKAVQNAKQAELQETATAWEARLQEAEKADLADIRETANVLATEFSSLPEDYGEYLAMTLMSMDKGPEVMNYLVEHMDEARNIVASGRTKATIALGRIEAGFLSNEDGKVKPKVTAAPEPPKNVNRGSNGKFAVSPDTDDLDAFSDLYYSKRR